MCSLVVSEELFLVTMGLRVVSRTVLQSGVNMLSTWVPCVFASWPRRPEQLKSPWKTWNSSWWSSTILSLFSEPKNSTRTSSRASPRSMRSRCCPYRRIWMPPEQHFRSRSGDSWWTSIHRVKLVIFVTLLCGPAVRNFAASDRYKIVAESSPSTHTKTFFFKSWICMKPSFWVLFL